MSQQVSLETEFTGYVVETANINVVIAVIGILQCLGKLYPSLRLVNAEESLNFVSIIMTEEVKTGTGYKAIDPKKTVADSHYIVLPAYLRQLQECLVALSNIYPKKLCFAEKSQSFSKTISYLAGFGVTHDGPGKLIFAKNFKSKSQETFVNLLANIHRALESIYAVYETSTFFQDTFDALTYATNQASSQYDMHREEL